MFKTKPFIKFFLLLLISCFLLLNFSFSAYSQTRRLDRLPVDMSTFSLSDLGAIEEDMTFNGILYPAGTRAINIIQLGAFFNTRLPNLTINTFLNSSGLTPSNVPISQMTFLQNFNVLGLVRFIPGLGNRRLRDVPVLSELYRQQIGSGWFSRRSIRSMLNRRGFGNLNIGQLTNLDTFSMADLPGTENTTIRRIPQWKDVSANEIPGLDRTPMRDYIDIPFQVPVALFDLPYSDQEAYRLRSVTGSYLEGFQVDCNKSACEHIELGPPITGSHWISGRSQLVLGGSGCLTGLEPTGRNPFGASFKVILMSTNESAGTAFFGMSFNFTIICGTSPYIIGPFPFYQAREKQPIILGF